MTLDAAGGDLGGGPSRRALAIWVAVWTVLAVGLAYLASTVDWAGVGAALRSANLAWVALAIGASLLGTPMWALAWRLLTPPERPAGFIRLFEAQAVTLAAIQCFSILGGGAVALVLLVRRVGLTRGAAVSILAFDQLLTGLVKIIILGMAIGAAPVPAWMRSTAASLLAAVAALLIAMWIIAGSEDRLRRRAGGQTGTKGRLLIALADLTAHFSALRSPSRFGGALILYLFRRLLETVVALCIQKACGIPLSVEAAILTVAAVALASLIPGPPANLGVYEAAVALAYQWRGVPPDLAVAAALLQHVATLVAALAPGCIVLATRRVWTSAEGSKTT